MHRPRLPIAVTSVILAIAIIHGQSQSVPKQKEQTHFSAKDKDVNLPAAIPAGVLAILAKDELVLKVLNDQKIAPADLPASWFSAARVQLRRKGEQDLIVASKGPIVGANISPFWVFVQDRHGFRLALSISVHDLIVNRTRSHGYRDLEVDGMTASTIATRRFRFDGNEYKKFSEKTEDIK